MGLFTSLFYDIFKIPQLMGISRWALHPGSRNITAHETAVRSDCTSHVLCLVELSLPFFFSGNALYQHLLVHVLHAEATVIVSNENQENRQIAEENCVYDID